MGFLCVGEAGWPVPRHSAPFIPRLIWKGSAGQSEQEALLTATVWVPPPCTCLDKGRATVPAIPAVSPV